MAKRDDYILHDGPYTNSLPINSFFPLEVAIIEVSRGFVEVATATSLVIIFLGLYTLGDELISGN